MSAINDLKRNTDGVLDFDNEIATSGDDPLKFFYTMTDQYSKCYIRTRRTDKKIKVGSNQEIV